MKNERHVLLREASGASHRLVAVVDILFITVSHGAIVYAMDPEVDVSGNKVPLIIGVVLLVAVLVIALFFVF